MSASAEASATAVDLTSISAEEIITFSEGLVGLPEWKRFVLLTLDEEEAGVGLLQSIDNQQLSLMVTNPVQFLPGYSVDLTDHDREHLSLGNSQEPLVLTTLSVHGETITTNLVGPLVINTQTRTAKQLVLSDSSYSTRHPVAQVEGQEA
jgi:flagellar assembly factor FliW